MCETLFIKCVQVGGNSAPCHWEVVKKARGSVLHHPLGPGALYNSLQMRSCLPGQPSLYLLTAALHATHCLDWHVNAWQPQAALTSCWDYHRLIEGHDRSFETLIVMASSNGYLILQVMQLN